MVGINRPHRIEVALDEDEFTAIEAAAAREGISLSNFLRRCINGFFLDSADDAVLVRERHRGRQPQEIAHG